MPEISADEMQEYQKMKEQKANQRARSIVRSKARSSVLERHAAEVKTEIKRLSK